MKRHELEHVVRASGAITGIKDLIIIGSQSVLGAFPDAPDELVVSQEVDLYPEGNPAMADLIDGSIGELSFFHEQFGYYAHGVGVETAILPEGWKERLIPIENDNTGGSVGWCLHPRDLAVSKLAAGRSKDVEFVHVMIMHRLVEFEAILRLCESLHADVAPFAVQHLMGIHSRIQKLDSEG